MGQLKSQMIAEHERRVEIGRWLSEKKDWRCKRCGDLIEYTEETLYYLTGYCSSCEHVMSKAKDE
jgi:hypothetical protein